MNWILSGLRSKPVLRLSRMKVETMSHDLEFLEPRSCVAAGHATRRVS